MKFRKSKWLDTNSMSPVFGIECKLSPHDRWLHCYESGEPLIFDTEGKRDAKLKELKDKESLKT